MFNNVKRCNVVINKMKYQRKVLVCVVCFSLAVCGICLRLHPFFAVLVFLMASSAAAVSISRIFMCFDNNMGARLFNSFLVSSLFYRPPVLGVCVLRFQ